MGQSYRWSDLDFEANSKDGYGVDWPIRYKDIEPWYSHVEKFIGVSGEKLDLPQLPDSEFLPLWSLIVWSNILDTISENYDDRVMTIGRVAHITKEIKRCRKIGMSIPQPLFQRLSLRQLFQFQLFNLPYAEATGNLIIRSDSIVSEVIYDPKTQKASGVRVIDAHTKEVIEFNSVGISLCFRNGIYCNTDAIQK